MLVLPRPRDEVAPDEAHRIWLWVQDHGELALPAVLVALVALLLWTWARRQRGASG